MIKKIVVLKCSDLSEVTVQGIQSGPVSNVISAMIKEFPLFS